MANLARRRTDLTRTRCIATGDKSCPNAFRNLIAGEWVAGATANAEPQSVRRERCDRRVCAGRRRADARPRSPRRRPAFPAWATGSIQERANILDRAGSEILARKDELGRLLSREEGKTLPEGIGEAARAGYIFKFFAGEVLRLIGDKLPSVRPGIDVEVTREPIGVVGLITPWNFPIAIPAWKIAPALAYGNTVVMKPADLVPGCAWAIAEILVKAGIPAGVFNLVMGRGSVVGETLVNHPDVAAISFTGSVTTGRGIAAKAIARMAKVQLEMGGKNPLVVLDDADLRDGRQLRGAGRVLLDRAALHGVVAADRHRGHPRPLRRGDHGKAQGAQGRRRARAGHRHRARRRPEPARHRPQVHRDRQERRREARGRRRAVASATPTAITSRRRCSPEATNAMRIAREEIFGPVACVIRARDYDEALALANDTEFGLCSGIVTTSLKHASHFKRHAQAGMVMVNLPTAGVDYHVPFGGRKGSSYGTREQGRYAAEFFTTVKTAYIAP